MASNSSGYYYWRNGGGSTARRQTAAARRKESICVPLAAAQASLAKQSKQAKEGKGRKSPNSGAGQVVWVWDNLWPPESKTTAKRMRSKKLAIFQLSWLLYSAPSYMIWVPKSDKDLFEFPLDNHQILCFLTYLLPSSNVYDMCSYEQICTFTIKTSGKDTKTCLESRV